MSDDKRTPGHPPIIKSVEELNEKIEEYFKSLLPKPIIVDGKAVETDKGHAAYTKAGKPSVVGLALFLGYATKQSIYDNIKNGKYSYSLKRAVSMIELATLENGMDEKIPQSLSIFLLKNFGYSDKPQDTQDDFSHDKSLLAGLMGGDDE